MPCDGSLILSDVHGPTLAIVCEPCGRRGRYRVERLLAEHRTPSDSVSNDKGEGQ